MTSPNSLYDTSVLYGGCGAGDVSDNGIVLGNAWVAVSGTFAGSGPRNFDFILQSGTCIAFDSHSHAGLTVPSNLIIEGTNVVLDSINNQGWAIGYGGADAVVWTGTATGFTQLTPMEAANALSNTGQVVGETGTTGYLWTSGSASSVCSLVHPGQVQSLLTLTSTAYQNEITNINPIDISGTNATDGSVRILFGAQYQGVPNAGPPPSLGGASVGWFPGTFLLTLTSGSNPSLLQQVSLPSNVTTNLNAGVLNAQGLIADIGNVTTSGTTGSNHAVLLLPVQFKQVYPDSGLDWVSHPNWLMVPQSGTNQAIAVTPASSNLTINFSIQPGSPSTGSVMSPTSTSSSNQTITVSGTSIGETTQVQIGVGTTIASGINSAGLGIDVKPMTTGTIAIHAVTQHYIVATGSSPSGGWTPNTICIAATGGALWTGTTGGDDVQSGLEINTGPNGICETTADPRDAQPIPIGEGIPKDIVPQDAPTAADLQTYLNQVFGIHANLYFSVVRDNFSVNYDLNNDGKLEVSGSLSSPTAEEQVITSNSNGAVNYNIYYVGDYVELTGTAQDHSSIGITNWLSHTSYVRDNTVILNLTTHEIGHLLDLNHTNDYLLPNNDWNPASIYRIPDPSPSDRLMYPSISGSSTLLIKPEWDVINPNPPL